MKILFILLFLLTLQIAHAQNYFAKTLQIGTTGSFIYERMNDGEDSYRETVWSKHIALRVSKDFWVGFSHQNIWEKNIIFFRETEYRAFYFSVFSQFKLRLSKRLNGRLQLGYATGNHCTCTDEISVNLSDVRYLNWAFGMDIQLYRGLYLDLGIDFNYLLNYRDLNPTGYNIGRAGIHYKFGRLD